MRRRTLVVLAVTVGLGLAAAVVAGVAANGDRRSPDDVGTGVRSTQNPHDVETYWTEERKNRATGG
jgi:hypothetical protein